MEKVLLLLLLLSLTCCLLRWLLAEQDTSDLELQGCFGVLRIRVLKHLELFGETRDGLRV